DAHPGVAGHPRDAPPAQPDGDAAAVGGAAACRQPHHLPPRADRLQAQALRRSAGGDGPGLLCPRAGAAARVISPRPHPLFGTGARAGPEVGDPRSFLTWFEAALWYNPGSALALPLGWRRTPASGDSHGTAHFLSRVSVTCPRFMVQAL